MQKEKKDFQRTIRMTQTTKDILLEQEGQGLNEKFQNLVYKAHLKENELDQQIQEKEAHLKKLQLNIYNANATLTKLEEVKYHIEQILAI